jgi:isoamylase
MASLLLSQGVPMLSGGDELGRTQRGNNNAYCQDNEISWTHWAARPEAEELLMFTRRLIAFRKAQAVLRRRNFFQGRALRGAGVKDIMWLDPSGREMTDDTWSAPEARSLGVLLAGDAIDEVDARGQRVAGDTLLVLYNAAPDAAAFVLPADGAAAASERAHRWATAFETAVPDNPPRTLAAGDRFDLPGHAMAVFVRCA